MATRQYDFIDNDDNKAIADFCRDIARIRQEDIDDFNNLTNVFIRGRKVGKIPTSSVDISVTDRVGDFNYDANYLYICVNDTTAAWRRVALESW